MTTDVNYVRYSPDIETVRPDEGETIQAIVASMTHESEITAARYKHAVRASHAKSHGLLKGELRVLDGLAAPLRQGLFAKAETYPVAVRMAVGPGELLSDAVSTHRGMAIKVFNVSGEKLPDHHDDTQDFVLATGPAFPQADAAGFLKAIKGLEKATPKSETFKEVVSTAARVTNAAIGQVSGTLDFFGHPPLPPLADTYYSQAAMRYGDYVAKIAVTPVTPALVALAETNLDVKADPDAFRHSVVDFLKTSGAEFELRVQLSVDLHAMPVEDASKVWSETESPYVAVARIVLPPQDAYGSARQAFMDDVMSFRPSHSLQAHRPLGSLMRARLATYPQLSAFRHSRNAQEQREPLGIDEIPN